MIPFIHFGSFQIPTFFLVISLSLSILLILLSRRVTHFSKNRIVAFDIALLLMVAGFLGGRLMHVFYEEWTYYLQNPEQILYFWNGGFVFLGGVAGCLLAGFVYTRIKKIDFFAWADFFTPLFSLAHALGRIGCILSGCCFGRFCVLPWAYNGRHPTAFYLFFGEMLIFAILLLLEKKKFFTHPGSLLISWLSLHSLMRFVVEFYRDDFRGLFIQLPPFGAISISQLLSLIILLFGIGFFIKNSFKK